MTASGMARLAGRGLGAVSTLYCARGMYLTTAAVEEFVETHYQVCYETPTQAATPLTDTSRICFLGHAAPDHPAGRAHTR